MNTASATSQVVGDLWRTGNWWARRLLIGAVIWHLATLAVGLIGVPIVMILFMVVAGSAITIAAIWHTQPLIPIFAAFTRPGRTAIHWIAAVIGLELALGTYLATVPVGLNWNTRVLALMALSAAFTAIVLKISGSSWKTLKTVLWLKFIVLTALIYGYGLMPDMFPALRETWFKEQANAAERIKRGGPLFEQPTKWQTTPRQPQIITVPIRPDRWSDWVTLPGGRDFEIDFPGDRTYEFAGGRVVTVRAGENTALGSVPNTFRFKGTAGVVTITLK